MNLFFVICTVFGVTLLSCVTLLSVLGLDEKQCFVDQDWNSGNEELSDLGSTQIDPSPGTNSRYPSSLLRGVGAGIAFFGLTGSATHAIHMSDYHAIGLSLLAGTIAFLGVGLLMHRLPFDPFVKIEDSDEITDIPHTESKFSDAAESR